MRINIEQVNKYYPIPVPLKVPPEQWAGKEDAWEKNTHPFAFEINRKMKEKKDIVLDLIRRYYNYNKTLTLPGCDQSIQFNIFRQKDLNWGYIS